MLPSLPKKNKRKESDLGTWFTKWFFTRPMPNGDYELKDTRGKNYLNYNEITEDQINSALRTQSTKGNLIRIINGTPGSPDYKFTKNGQAFFVIRYPKSVEIITIENLLFERDRNKKIKSLTYLRAKAISTISI